ncbi:MAG: cytochrome d ubiquinol oxidase subunit II [Pseudomonadota bacterium]
MTLVTPDLTTPAGWLPLAFMIVMGIAMLAYVILDGFDLGVGLVLPLATDSEKDLMIASIGPFWDANETWLVLGVGILLVAFPMAHGQILTALYLPVSVMLIGLTLRGVAFDFRVKARADRKAAWNRAFFAGSLMAAFAQGYMLGKLVLGFEQSWFATLFSAFIGLCLASSYALMGCCWLVGKTSDDLQRKAIRWARYSVALTAIGVATVSIATPLLSNSIFDKWFTLANLIVVWPIPMITGVLFIVLWRSLRRLPVRLDQNNEYGIWVPFLCVVGLFMLAFHGLAYSLFPWIIIDEMTIWDAASATESLGVIFAGAVVVLPVIVGYSIFVYRVFGGKAKPLEYY